MPVAHTHHLKHRQHDLRRRTTGQDHGVRSLCNDATGLEAALQPSLAFAERDSRWEKQKEMLQTALRRARE